MSNGKRPHPAKFSNELLPTISKYAYGIILDPMGGVGKIGLLKKQKDCRVSHIVINEIESEWAEQAFGNMVDAVLIGDARYLTGRYDCIVTSPPYGNRMADNFKAFKPDSMRRRYAGDLGRNPSIGSVACKHWGRGYQEMMIEIYDNIIVNVKFDRFILNVSNFIRDFKEIDVIGFYIEYFKSKGFCVLAHEKVITRRQKGVGANTNLRVLTESIIVFERGESL